MLDRGWPFDGLRGVDGILGRLEGRCCVGGMGVRDHLTRHDKISVFGGFLWFLYPFAGREEISESIRRYLTNEL